MLYITKGYTSTLYIVFASWLEDKNKKYDKNDFENTLNKIFDESHKIYLKDLSNSWFINGIEEYPSIWKLLNFIYNYIITHKIKKIIFIGSSMGGFASLLYGKLFSHYFNLKVNVLAFSPQTDISINSNIITENSWTLKNIQNTVWKSKNAYIWDLNNFLNIKSNMYSFCICGKLVNFDCLNIDHIYNNINNIWKIDDCSEHNSAYFLLKNNKLLNILHYIKNI